MATFNGHHSTTNAADLLGSSVAVAAAATEHFERSTAAATTTFLVPSAATPNGGPLHLEPFSLAGGGPHFVTTTTSPLGGGGASHNHHQQHQHQQQQHHHHHHHQQTNSTSTSYTFVQIKREPCQVSEVTSANCHQTQQQQQQQQHNNHHHHHQQQHHVSTTSGGSVCGGGGIGVGIGMGVGVAAASSSTCSTSISGASKTMSSSSTLTTLVKIEASSPKVNEMDKTSAVNTLTATASTMANTNNTVPIGIAVARKRPQETAGPLTNSTAIPMQQTLNKDMNCFGIRVADLGGVGTGCSNIYFTGNGDLVAGSATAEEFALSAAGVQSVNRAPSTFWQYQNALPIESVISMSPATVGLQYSRDASRGQVVLLPATPAALGISNFPIYTPTDPFQQAAAFVWPSYIPQGTTPAAAAAAATLQPPPNFIFPSMSPHSTLQPQSYATSLQLFGSNYLTAAAAAAAAAAATSTLCQHNQQQQTNAQQTANSINLSLTGAGPPTGSGGNSFCGNNSNNNANGRFFNLTTTGGASCNSNMIDATKSQKTLQPTLTLPQSVPPPSASSLPLPLPMPLPPPPSSLILPPTSMKVEEWNAADFMAAAAAAAARTGHTTTTLGASSSATTTTHPMALNFESRHKMTATTTNTATTSLLDLHNAATAAANAQALNLMRLPTPPTSATMETAAAAATSTQMQQQILFQTASTPSPALLNLSASLSRGTAAGSIAVGTTTVTPTGIFLNGSGGATPTGTLSASIGPPTPLGDETTAINFKTSRVETVSQQSASGGIVVGVPRVINCGNGGQPMQPEAPPQMQDVNIQTDTPVCSDDENSCPLAMHQHQQQQQQLHTNDGPNYMSECDVQQPLELTKQSCHGNEVHNSSESAGVGLTTTKTTSTEPTTTSTPTETNHLECHTEEGNITTNVGIDYHVNTPQPTPSPTTAPLAAHAAIEAKAIPMHTINEQKIHNEQHEPNQNLYSEHQHSQQSAPEDLTGLELLSNISTSTLASKGIGVGVGVTIVRVKQEPLDQMDVPVSSIDDEAAIASMPTRTSSQMSHFLQQQQTTLSQQASTANCDSCISTEAEMQRQPTPLSSLIANASTPAPPVVEPLGGLNLLCALAEQRIQEEVQSSRGNLFADRESSPPPPPSSLSTTSFGFQTPQLQLGQSQLSEQQKSTFTLEQSSFPSMEGIELPSTSGLGLGLGSGIEKPIKRKKHKHSKSSKSSSSAVGGGISKKSQRCSKKSKKKYAKEKRKHKQQQLLASAAGASASTCASADDVDLEDEQLQQELRSAFNRVDPNFQLRFGQWANAKEIFELMESDMRMRLADITRQYRKKKRKLDEISKNKKKKKCAKLLAAQMQQQQPTLSLSSLSAASSGGSLSCVSATAANTSLPLCDYKFPKFSTNGVVGAASTPYLNRSSFLRFGEKAPSATGAPPPHAQFPPAECDNSDENNGLSSTTSSINGPPTTIYKPVRLGPSTLAGAVAAASVGIDMRNSVGGCGAGSATPQRHAQKHLYIDKCANSASVCKEPKLMAGTTSSSSLLNTNRLSTTTADEQQRLTSSTSSTPTHKFATTNIQQQKQQLSSKKMTSFSQPQQQQHTQSQQQPQQQQQCRKPADPRDYELMLTSEHLYRKETRVLADMGGLFYAGVMKPLQPPDVYAITLDGERGNKSHIMSREEIFKDTILEVAPKSVESVPIGTRLCAYWSQQYRCLYPGRAIESESSEDGETPNDSVSVEFDDGDSGRIRLQNIRFLLSDYPIVEYNDNPLYSLGKHKKNGATAVRNANSSGGSCHNSNDAHEHINSFALGVDVPTAFVPTLCGSSESTLQNSKEISAQRKEKKRIKNLKKKSQAVAALAAAAAATTTTTVGTINANGISSAAMTAMNGTTGTSALSPVVSSVNGINGIGSGGEASADCNRKHHKHKKRKKHKKHHHRKVNGECEAINGANNTFVIKNAGIAPNSSFLSSTPTTHFKGKREFCTKVAAGKRQNGNTVGNDNYLDDDDDDDDDDEEDDVPMEDDGEKGTEEQDNDQEEDVVQITKTHGRAFQSISNHSNKKSQMQNNSACLQSAASVIKLEAASTISTTTQATTTATNAKVKTENLDLEEESTSNMMSELSDENKCDDDEVEHNNSKGSKIAAFLPERQLWGWQGKAYRKAGVKGRARKQFYKTIKRGKETITVGNCAVFLSTGRPDRPYIGRIESMWETTSSNKVVRVRWFYHPEETTGCPNLKYPGALFESPHEDENDVQTISHRCEVLPFERYFDKFGSDTKQYQLIYDNNDTYYLAGYYNPRIQVLNLQDDIPILKAEQQQKQLEERQEQTHLAEEQQSQKQQQPHQQQQKNGIGLSNVNLENV